ncbi:hypothetical protein Pure05_09660 [Paenarthrobacter ureafaciens]|nr:hypothetical protein NicSoilE8_13580 [Arthrobacter sp. NicSoilE8]GLU57904.1 hypothetical protein Pure01_04170 [Paenarthrobacter ureafaciens]GLU62719.1 hypothetical protein Pure02_09690 [Paenarthrobacter ureafaciens]GLU66793.1 hypothetical protein Pure03_07690 [Paenarthrobacter ureafaciens]GLU70905.1 hypothetical protein Pure04_06200 [Paenarthrobacter ureafaciens]
MPLPEGPIKPVIRPGMMLNSNPRRIVVRPLETCNPEAAIAAVSGSWEGAVPRGIACLPTHS